MLNTIAKLLLLTLLLVTICNFKPNAVAKTMPKTSSENTLNLNFNNIPVRTALQTLAKFAHTNISINEKVSGNITLSLQNVTWQQALNIILTTQGLIQRQVSHVIIITPAEQLLTQQQQQNQLNQTIEDSQPMISKTFHIKYGKAQTYYDTLKYNHNGLLSTRGVIMINKRTNSLFIKDAPTRLNLIEDYLQKTDIPVRQIEIAARIVTIDKSFERQLGVKWKIKERKKTNGSSSADNHFKIDFGAASIANTMPANIAMSTLASNVLLDLELSAIQAAGGGEILSSPRLLTADQQEAIIEQGTEIPYNETTRSGGTAVTFKKALLRLKVTPQITPHNQVLLRLEVNQDAKSTDINAGNMPLIDTRHISTNILVNNGETVVLGGIYERSKSHSVVRVPFMSSIPLLGKLFRSKAITDKRKELLIFVTPHIVNKHWEQSKYSSMRRKIPIT